MMLVVRSTNVSLLGKTRIGKAEALRWKQNNPWAGTPLVQVILIGMFQELMMCLAAAIISLIEYS